MKNSFRYQKFEFLTSKYQICDHEIRNFYQKSFRDRIFWYHKIIFVSEIRIFDHRNCDLNTIWRSIELWVYITSEMVFFRPYCGKAWGDETSVGIKCVVWICIVKLPRRAKRPWRRSLVRINFKNPLFPFSLSPSPAHCGTLLQRIVTLWLDLPSTSSLWSNNVM